jgi:ribonuclease D
MVAQRKIVALDTEFTRQSTYYPILSIIQVAVKNHAGVKESFIIDCLCGLNLSSFFELIADKNIVKILHSSSQDLQIFHKQSGLFPQNIVDTQILANFCGLGFNVGYSHLVSTMFGRELNKKQQRSDWQRRPLSESQIKYALLDVFYLEEIYEKLSANLPSQKGLFWYQEEVENFTKKITSNSEENLLKRISLRRKTPKQVAQISRLISWREGWARKIDVPRQHLLRDEQIESLVENQLYDVNLGRKITAEMYVEIKEILLSEEEMDCEEKSLNANQRILFDQAKKLNSKIAAEKNFSDQFLLTNSDLKKIVSKQNNINQIITGWRYELIGGELERLINNS